MKTRPVTDDDGRLGGGLEQLNGGIELLLRRRNVQRRDSALWRLRFGFARVNGLNLIREGEVRNVAFEQGMFNGQAHELGVFTAGFHTVVKLRHRLERSYQIHLLKIAGAHHLCGYLACQRKNRRAINLGVPKSGEHVGAARPGDRKTGRRFARKFSICRGRERGCPFVANSNVLQLALFLKAAERICEAQVRVADHTEYLVHAPINHRFGHQV